MKQYLGIFIGILLAISFSLLAFSEPTQAPPVGNVAAPLNISGTPQTKAGNLNIGAGLSYWITKVGDSFALQDNAGNTRLILGQDGNVGIGTAIPGQKLDVAGTINAFNITTGNITIQGKKACLSDGTDCPASVSSVTCYQDADGDGYTTGTIQTVTVGNSCPAGYITNPAGSDCYDNNANAKPGQISYFTSHRGDGSFDYDCNSLETKDVTSYSYCVGSPLCKACTFSGCDAGTCINTGTTPACGSTYTQSGYTQGTCDLGAIVCNCNSGTTRTVACK